MNAIDFNLSAATTAELVVFYNAHSGRPAIKKFSDRATGIARCAAIQAELRNQQAKEEPTMSETNDPVVQQDEDIVSNEATEQAEVAPTAEAEVAPTAEATEQAEAKPYVAGTCPACGSTDLAPNGEAGTVAGDEQKSCNACGHAFWVENGASVASSRQEANKRIAEAVAATWNDPAVKAKRMERHNIYVTDMNVEGAAEVYYKSVLDAFKALGLMISRHIKFRAACKAAGDAGKVYEETKADGTVVKYLFRAVEQPKAEPKPKAEKKAKAEGSAATGKKRGRKSNAEKAAAAEEAAAAQPVASPDDVEVEEV